LSVPDGHPVEIYIIHILQVEILQCPIAATDIYFRSWVPGLAQVRGD